MRVGARGGQRVHVPAARAEPAAAAAPGAAAAAALCAAAPAARALPAVAAVRLRCAGRAWRWQLRRSVRPLPAREREWRVPLLLRRALRGLAPQRRAAAGLPGLLPRLRGLVSGWRRCSRAAVGAAAARGAAAAAGAAGRRAAAAAADAAAAARGGVMMQSDARVMASKRIHSKHLHGRKMQEPLCTHIHLLLTTNTSRPDCSTSAAECPSVCTSQCPVAQSCCGVPHGPSPPQHAHMRPLAKPGTRRGRLASPAAAGAPAATPAGTPFG